jgi:hypothetical protein
MLEMALPEGYTAIPSVAAARWPTEALVPRLLERLKAVTVARRLQMWLKGGRTLMRVLNPTDAHFAPRCEMALPEGYAAIPSLDAARLRQRTLSKIDPFNFVEPSTRVLQSR